MGSALAASASPKKGKKRRRRTLSTTPCSGGRNGVDDAVGGGTAAARDWSGLPEPAVHLILMALLPSLADAFYLGSVCKAWRSVFAASKRELFSALPPMLIRRNWCPHALVGYYCLRERRFHRRKQPDNCGDRLFNPGGMTAISLSHGYWIVRVMLPGCFRSFPVFLVDPLSPEVRIHLPQAPHYVSGAVMAAPPASPDCVVVLLQKEHVLYCRPGDTQWVRHSSVVEGADYNAHSVAIVGGGKLYTLHTDGKVVMVELLFPQPTVTFLDIKLPLPEKSHISFLMESNGEILHVAHVCKVNRLVYDHELPPCTEEHKFIVRRLDIPAREWVTLSTLGDDRCLFLNLFATGLTWVAPARWGGGEGDCIYTFCCALGALLVFHMKDGRVEHHQLPEEHSYYDWLTPSFCYL